MQSKSVVSESISFQDFKEQVLHDYSIAVISRECSLLGRREVLTGKAKFGIFGDGKELPQLAMARASVMEIFAVVIIVSNLHDGY